MLQQELTFDAQLGDLLKRVGMEAAALCRADALRMAREGVRRAALGRECRTATADDAYAYLEQVGMPLGILGNAAGSIFRGDEWVSHGHTFSERTSNHRRQIRVWKLID